MTFISMLKPWTKTQRLKTPTLNYCWMYAPVDIGRTIYKYGFRIHSRIVLNTTRKLYECTYCTSVLIMYWLYECTECTSVLIVWMYWLYECTNGIDNSVPGKKCRLFYIKLCKCTMITNYDIYTIHSFKWHVCYVWDGVFALFSWLRVSKVTLIVPILEFYYMSTQSQY